MCSAEPEHAARRFPKKPKHMLPMKHIIRPTLFAAIAFGASTISLFAQTASPGPQGPPDGPPPPPGHHGPPPPSELFKALDTNHDGVISADEIANAPAVLKALADSSGQITRESLRPKHPEPDDQQAPDDRRGPRADHERRDHRPPPDAQDSPAANADRPANPPPDERRGPDGRRHGPPPRDDDRDRTQDRPAATPAASAAASPGASPAPAPGGRPHGPPHGGPLFDALDTNHDGVISADEIANAPAALKALDKNGDGQLTRDELRPPPPPPGPRD